MLSHNKKMLIKNFDQLPPKGVRRKLFLVRFFWSRHPFQMALISLGQITTAISEGIGITLMVVALKNMVSPVSSDSSGDSYLDSVFRIVEAIGLDNDLGLLLAVVVGVIGLKATVDALVLNYINLMGVRAVAEARLQMITAVTKSKWGFFATQKVGRFANALNLEATAYSSLLINICTFFARLIAAIIFMTFSLVLSFELTIGMLIASIGIIWLLKGFVKISEQTSYRLAALHRSLASRITDCLQGIKSLRAMGMVTSLTPFLEKEIAGLKKAQFMQGFAKVGLMQLREPLIALTAGVGIFLAVKQMGIEVFSIIAILILFQRLANNVGQLQGAYQTVTNYEGSFFSFNALLHGVLEHQETDPISNEKIGLKSELVLKDIDFGYREGEKILDNICAEFPKGTLTVIIGESGTGKTSILDLICRLYVPLGGEILVDGKDLSTVNLDNWRRRIGYVEQDSVLFHDSVRANIDLNNQYLSENDIVDALTIAGVIDTVLELPESLDSIIGEKGVLLSGGQRQRITIARALARKPDLLLLDEATTALDPETEKKILNGLRERQEKMTIIAVSHQPAISSVADQIYRLVDMKLVKIKG